MAGLICTVTAMLLATTVVSTRTALASEPLTLVLKNHAFAPATLQVPANARFRLDITNQDATPAEFESTDLRAEKIVVPGGTIHVMAGPLKPGTYAFFDDYHPDSAKGQATAIIPQAGPAAEQAAR